MSKKHNGRSWNRRINIDTTYISVKMKDVNSNAKREIDGSMSVPRKNELLINWIINYYFSCLFIYFL